MAGVMINKGMPGPEEPALELPRERWRSLAIARRQWARIDLPFDCRLLRIVVDEAPLLAEELGLESGDRFLTEYLSLDLDLVGRVLGWLEREQPTEAVPLDLVDKATAAMATPLAAHGEIGNGRADESRGDNVTSTDRGNSQPYLLRRLARDRPDILERVQSGEIRSARAAAIEAGIIKPVPTVRLVNNPVITAAAIVERMDHEWCIAMMTAMADRLVSDPVITAAAIVERMDREWCIAMATAMAEQIRDAGRR